MNIPLADKAVHCVVTSPPYWGLRKYTGEQSTFWSFSADGEVDECAYGLEPTIEAYVEHSLMILREVRRVLRDDGVCWWNLGDSYFGSWGNYGGQNRGNGDQRPIPEGSKAHQKSYDGLESWRPPTAYSQNGLKPLDLCLIPERVALAAQADGWYVRSLVIWAKPNPMPESVNGWRWERHRVKVKSQDYGEYSQPGKLSSGEISGGHRNRDAVGGVWLGGAQWSDCPGCPKCSPNDGLVLRKGSWRPTDAYEHILMLTKTDDYFGDAEAVKEAAKDWGTRDRSNTDACTIGVMPDGQPHKGLTDINFAERGRNLRNVWTFPTQPYPEAHFATFPERLPEICIKASTGEKGCCQKCGACWVRVIEIEDPNGRLGKGYHNHEGDLERGQRGVFEAAGAPVRKTTGWRPTCSCNASAPVPCTVLDPFGGSGTTARVALRLNRRAVSLDLAYHGLARKRTTEVQPELMGVL